MCSCLAGSDGTAYSLIVVSLGYARNFHYIIVGLTPHLNRIWVQVIHYWRR
jgi:hypothetical protein